MKRAFGMCVMDSDVEEEEPSPKRGSGSSLTLWKCDTPSSHHDVHPSTLSPFVSTSVERTEGFPVKTAEETDISVKEYFDRFVKRTPDQCAAEASAAQRSLEWKEARKFALTGSDFGSASGTNPFCSPMQLVSKKLWDNFAGNDATKWGSHCEPLAAEAFLEWARRDLDPEAKLHSFGLLKWSMTPWLAVSPDGVLEWTDKGSHRFDLVEFKCPTRVSTDGHPYSKYPNNTPPYYLDQMLGIWGLVAENGGIVIEGVPRILQESWFVVWQPMTLWVTRHSFSDTQWSALRLKLRQWYFGRFLPALVWRFNGLLEHGDAAPSSAPLDLRQFKTQGPASSECGSTSESKNVGHLDGETHHSEVDGGVSAVRGGTRRGIATLVSDDA